MDDQHGVLATTWRDSGYRVVVSPQGAEFEELAKIVRRYEVLVSSRSGGATARLLVDGRRCTEPFSEEDVIGTCSDATFDGAVLKHDLDVLAKRIAARTGTSVAVVESTSTTR
jgi:hypothetical protein